MLLCRDKRGQRPVVQVLPNPLHPEYKNNSALRNSEAISDVFRRLQQEAPPSLSKPAFDTAANRAHEEETACTFSPHTNHTHDDVLRAWSAGADVFQRLYGHARCQREEQLHIKALRAQEEVEVDDAFHQRFRMYTFPSHLYDAAAPSRRGNSSLIAPPRTSIETSRTGVARERRRLPCGAHERVQIRSPLLTARANHRSSPEERGDEQPFNGSARIPVLSAAAAEKAVQLLERMHYACLKRGHANGFTL